VIIPKKDLTDLEDCQRLHGAGAPSQEAQTEAQTDKPARTHASKAKAHKKSEK
jgi:hypothetical protein